jgi:YD repeat-containing protein
MKLIIILVLITNFGLAQYRYIDNYFLNSTTNSSHYNGKVKTVKRIYYQNIDTAISNFIFGNNTERFLDSLLNKNKLFYNTYIDSFSLNGNLLQSIHQSKDSKKHVTKYEYDSNGKCTFIIGKYIHNDSITNNELFFYNELHQLVQTKRYFSGKLIGESNFTYSSNGEVKTRERLEDEYFVDKVYRKDNKLTIKTYKINGMKVSTNEIIEDDTSVIEHSTFMKPTYINEIIIKSNKKNFYFQYFFYTDTHEKNFNAHFKSTTTIYDKFGNITLLTIEDVIKKNAYTTSVKYKYDKQGNITEMLIVSGNKNIMLEQFEYTYY